MVSNTWMHTHDHTEQRLHDLEIKASYLEMALEQLDAVIIRQQTQIDQLLREVTHLRHTATEPGSTHVLRDELPPHY